jgi:hypothetical protein
MGTPAEIICRKVGNSKFIILSVATHGDPADIICSNVGNSKFIIFSGGHPWGPLDS